MHFGWGGKKTCVCVCGRGAAAANLDFHFPVNATSADETCQFSQRAVEAFIARAAVPFSGCFRRGRGGVWGFKLHHLPLVLEQTTCACGGGGGGGGGGIHTLREPQMGAQLTTASPSTFQLQPQS